MSRKIIAYDCVNEATTSDLVDGVTERIEQGWEPFGSVSYSDGYQEAKARYLQAMVKYAPGPESENLL